MKNPTLDLLNRKTEDQSGAVSVAPELQPEAAPQPPAEDAERERRLSAENAEIERSSLERDYKQTLRAFAIAVDKAIDSEDRDFMVQKYKAANDNLGVILRRMDTFVGKDTPDGVLYSFGDNHGGNVLLSSSKLTSSYKPEQWFKAAFGSEDGAEKYRLLEIRTEGRFDQDLRQLGERFGALNNDNIVSTDPETIRAYLERGNVHIENAKKLRGTLLEKNMDSFRAGLALLARIDSFLKQKPLDMEAARKQMAAIEAAKIVTYPAE